LTPSKVSSQEFRVERLSNRHDRSAFSCGNDALDRYLREQAGQDQRRHLSTTFVLLDAADGELAGFYSLAASSISPSSLPEEIAKRLPRRPLPVTLIGRLAVDLGYRDRKLGRRLLADALIRAAVTSRDVGAMAVIVDAKDDAARAFYERHGFQQFVDDPLRLFIPMADVERQTRKP
jgi:GNAT superfamily N-acetyltransferase